jgi:aminoglycoside phosphotransferase (APT) family kinase protein
VQDGAATSRDRRLAGQGRAARNQIGWLTGPPSVDDLREVLGSLLPGEARGPVVLNHRVVTSDHRFFQGSAVVGGAYVVKFCWSEPPARRLVHEGHVLMALAHSPEFFDIPSVAAASTNPALLATRYVEGGPFTWNDAVRPAGRARSRLAEDLAAWLAKLHHQDSLTALRGAGVRLDAPEPQASTSDLRGRFHRFVTPGRARRVDEWCDWVDRTLAFPAEVVVLHGDLGGHNFVWNRSSGALRVVTDFETAGAGDPSFDFRYLPSHGPAPDFFFEVRSRYELVSGRKLDIDRVMAWHIRTVLGDALWRTEAGVPLPGNGGTASSWVDELEVRMRAMGCGS